MLAQQGLREVSNIQTVQNDTKDMKLMRVVIIKDLKDTAHRNTLFFSMLPSLYFDSCSNNCIQFINA